MIQHEQLDTINIDEMTNKFCQAGEASYRRGEFKAALDLFQRCVRAPRSTETRLAEIKSYWMLGMIYGYLGQDILSKENILRALKLSEESGYKKDVIICYICLIFFNLKLKSYEQALQYQETVWPMIKEYKQKETDSVVELESICLSYRGIICAKLGRMEESETILKTLEESVSNIKMRGFQIPMLSLALRVAYEKQDMEKYEQVLQEFLGQAIFDEGFFESLEFYFDICIFLFERKRPKEIRALLDYVGNYYDMIPLAYLKYRIRNFELFYAKIYGSEQEQWRASREILEIMPEYEAEQQRAKLYSFDYVEYMHEERNLSAKMEQKSKLDPMTGLFNKFSFEFLVDEYFKQMDEESTAAMLLLDMDHFKQINDTLGHLAGDALLIDTAKVIRHFFKEDALCGRIGGDEFMIFVKDMKDVSSLLLQAEFLRQEIGKTTLERNLTIDVGASVGIAVSTAGCRDYESMYTTADEALYRAKKEGRNRICVIE